MQQFQDIEYSKNGGCAHLRLNIPSSHNALTFRLIGELRSAISSLREQEDTTVLILSGAGGSFCSGDNLKDMGAVPHDGDWLKTIQTDWYQPVVESLRALPFPVVALAQGHVLGAGLELFMAADIKVATHSARLGIPFARLGIAAMNYHLPRQIGFTRAARMLFTGDVIDGSTAVAWGLATEVVEDAALAQRGDFWAEKFGSLSTRAIGTMKETFYQSLELDEQHWYDWWKSQWLNYLERRSSLGEEAMTPPSIPRADLIRPE